MQYQPFYEVAVWSAGEWRVTDSIADRDEAMGLARKMIHEAGVQGVQVSEERFDPTSELFRQRVLFRRQPETRRAGRRQSHYRDVDPVRLIGAPALGGRQRRGRRAARSGATALTGLTVGLLMGGLLIAFAVSRFGSLLVGF